MSCEGQKCDFFEYHFRDYGMIWVYKENHEQGANCQNTQEPETNQAVKNALKAAYNAAVKNGGECPNGCVCEKHPLEQPIPEDEDGRLEIDLTVRVNPCWEVTGKIYYNAKKYTGICTEKPGEVQQQQRIDA
jgi:hypothetical protein